MKTSSRFLSFKSSISLLFLFLFAPFISAQPVIRWEAFNDHRPSDLTSPNATGYDMRVTGDGGVLKDIKTGEGVARCCRGGRRHAR
jgi:hypothetical protein